MYAALPAASEVRSDGDGAYRAHAIAVFQVCEYALMPDAIDLQFSSQPTGFCYHLGCYSSGNCRGQQFGPSLILSNEVTMYHKSPGHHRKSTNFKK